MRKLGKDFLEQKFTNYKVKVGELDPEVVKFCFLRDIVKKNESR